MIAGPPVVVTAPAKLTWSLRVTGVRHDGFHLIDAEMVTLDLADELTITPGGSGIEVVGRYAAGVPTDGANLVARALRLADVTAGVRIDKRIPHGGGLGGGSADAAAVLRWAGGTTAARDVARLGADIPFCLVGGRARVTGIGEIVTALPHERRRVTLVVPPFGVSTPAVYRAWDHLGGPTGEINDLQPAALIVEPRLVQWRDHIAELAGSAPVLAGSGSTWFVNGERDNALAPLRSEGALVAVATTTPPRS